MSLTCPKCGAQTLDGDRFCADCGRDLTDIRAQTSKSKDTIANSRGDAGQTRALFIAGLIAAGLVVLAVGAYEMLELNSSVPRRSTTAPSPVAQQPEPLANNQPERDMAAITPAPRPEIAPPAEPALGCGNLIAPGEKLICAAFEPNWAIELSCSHSHVTSNFTDFFSSDDILKTPGTATLTSQNPWVFRTSQGLAGNITATPGGCLDDADRISDFTFTPSVVPGLDRPETICCRVER